MQVSEELKAMSIANSPNTEGQAAAGRIAAARTQRNNLGTISANQLSQPVDPVTVPQPQVSSIPPQSGQLVTNITRDNAGFIAAQTEEAKQVKDLQNQFAAVNEQGTLSDLFNTTRDQFGGGSDSLKELKDIQLQLTDMDTGSALTKTRIEGGAGQTVGQSQREVTQEDREAAVRSAGLAARASVIQGNIQTANAAAKSAVDIAYQDRTLKSTNLLNQITMVQSKVDEQTAQLLETEKRGYEADLAAVKELKDATQNAIINGASQAEVSQLMDSTVDDATKLALAQTITARGAGEMRGLEIEQSRASINASNASARNSAASAARSETGRLLDLAEAGDQEAIARLGLTMPDNSLPTGSEIAFARQFAATGTVPSGMSSEGVSFGKIAELASDLPKANGVVVDINTNVASPSLSAADNVSFDALFNAINSDLPLMIEAFEEMSTLSMQNPGGTGLVGGVISQAFPSEANIRFEAVKADFVAKLVLARSGAAATEGEVARYMALVPGKFNTVAGLGTEGTLKLGALQNQITAAFDDKLNSRGLAVYGYSTTNLNGESYTVGEIITSEYGQRGRVNPDGSITLINN